MSKQFCGVVRIAEFEVQVLRARGRREYVFFSL
jgi:hypothetical protein